MGSLLHGLHWASLLVGRGISVRLGLADGIRMPQGPCGFVQVHLAPGAWLRDPDRLQHLLLTLLRRLRLAHLVAQNASEHAEYGNQDQQVGNKENKNHP